MVRISAQTSLRTKKCWPCKAIRRKPRGPTRTSNGRPPRSGHNGNRAGAIGWRRSRPTRPMQTCWGPCRQTVRLAHRRHTKVRLAHRRGTNETPSKGGGLGPQARLGVLMRPGILKCQRALGTESRTARPGRATQVPHQKLRQKLRQHEGGARATRIRGAKAPPPRPQAPALPPRHP